MKLNPENISLDQLRQLWLGAEARLDDGSMERVARSFAFWRDFALLAVKLPSAKSGSSQSRGAMNSTLSPASSHWVLTLRA